MDENYIIDGNAVYEIDTDCAGAEKMWGGCSSKIETQMIFESGKELENKGKSRDSEDTVSVFF